MRKREIISKRGVSMNYVKITLTASLLFGGLFLSSSVNAMEEKVTNESGLSSMHGLNGQFENFSEENLDIPPVKEKAKDGGWSIQYNNISLTKQNPQDFRQKIRLTNKVMKDRIMLRLGHFSVTVLSK